jgi:hypothetical protein
VPPEQLDASTCLIKPIRLSTLQNEQTRVPHFVVNNIMKTAHSLSAHGGKTDVVWTLREIKGGESVTAVKGHVKKLVAICCLLATVSVIAFVYNRRSHRMQGVQALQSSVSLLTKAQS